VFVANQIAPAGDAIRDFFVETEAASGTRFNDFMEGTEDAGLAAGVFNELQNVNLIFNLDTFFVGGQAANWDATGAVIQDGTGFNTGNILLGGDGSDTITGRGGNDIIDGDAYLHVYLSGNGGLGSEIVREIGWDVTDGDIDVAVYRGNLADYTIDLTPDENGFITVRHNGTVNGAVNGVAIPVNEGTDKLRNIERLQFADGVFNLDDSPGANLPPTGQLLLVDDDANPATPVIATVGTPLTIDFVNSTLDDPDGINLATVQYQWQQQIVTAGGGQAWIDIGGATGTSFTPTNANLGNAIRVVETYTDNKGLVEHAYAQPTALVAANPAPLTNTAPFVVNQQGLTGFADTNARTGFPVNILLPLAQVFGDNETAANLLTFNATLADGTPLSSVGLTFTLIPDAVNGGFSSASITGALNTPGQISVKVSATDGGPGTPLTVTDTFVITVQTGNLAPVVNAAPESNTTVEDTAVIGQLLGPQVPDPDGPAAAPVWRLVKNSATNGTVSLNSQTGQYTFTPSAELSSDDLLGAPPVFSFQYRLFDGVSFSAVKTVTINVDAFDDGAAEVTITGTAAAGGTLSAIIGDEPDGAWLGGTDTYQWYRDGVAIDGATFADLSLTSDDIGHEFTVHASYTDAQGFVYEGASEIVSAAATVGDLRLTGIAGGGTPSRVAVTNTLTDPDGGIQADTVSYLWEISSDGIDFVPADAGVSADTLTYSPPQPGPGAPPNTGYVRVTVVYIDVLGNLNTATSEATHYVVDNTQTHTFSGTAMAELIFGNGGNDQITGLEGDDFVQGGAGADTFIATVDDGDDTYDGGNGTDTYNLSQTAAAATVLLAAGTATSAETGSDTLISIANVIGSAGSDTITGNGQANVFTGGAGDDTLNGGAGNDTAVFSGGLTNYSFSASGGNLVVTDARGGSPDGSDTLISMDTLQFAGQSFGAFVFGTNGNDAAVNGTNNGELLLGLAGNDTLNGNGGADFLLGGAGSDRLNGGGGNDTAVFTGPLSAYGFSLDGSGNLVVTDNRAGSPDGIDTLNSVESIQFGTQVLGLAVGSNGINALSTGGGPDLLLGFGGNDELDGGGGADIFIGGAGNDDFNFGAGDTGVGAGNRDTILDFLGGGGDEDIDLSALDANATTNGNQTFTFIGTAAFSDSNAGAQLAAGQVRYELFDSDGNGSLDSTLIQGNFNNNLAADFEIVLQGYTGSLVAADFIL
jgi:Ca2+-binding RTX toxin-like protein